MQNIQVDVVKMYPDVILPKYQTDGSAGCDVCAYLPKDKYPSGIVEIGKNETQLIPTGLKFSVPEGYEMQIRPRSGLSAKTKLRIANSPGTLDSDYRGELMIIMENIKNPPHGMISLDDNIAVAHGDRIAQLIFAPIVQAAFTVKESLDETERGSGGFGSTGK